MDSQFLRGAAVAIVAMLVLAMSLLSEPARAESQGATMRQAHPQVQARLRFAVIIPARLMVNVGGELQGADGGSQDGQSQVSGQVLAVTVVGYRGPVTVKADTATGGSIQRRSLEQDRPVALAFEHQRNTPTPIDEGFVLRSAKGSGAAWTYSYVNTVVAPGGAPPTAMVYTAAIP